MLAAECAALALTCMLGDGITEADQCQSSHAQPLCSAEPPSEEELRAKLREHNAAAVRDAEARKERQRRQADKKKAKVARQKAERKAGKQQQPPQVGAACRRVWLCFVVLKKGTESKPLYIRLRAWPAASSSGNSHR